MVNNNEFFIPGPSQERVKAENTASKKSTEKYEYAYEHNTNNQKV